MTTSGQDSCQFDEIIKKSILIEDGNPARYRLQTKTDNLDQSEAYRKMTSGEREKNKPHKTILMVGETGTGKTTLINTIVNYMLGVKREDKVWFEITDDQSDPTSPYSQTSIITVYGFYLQESPIHLTIIDTPGYGETRGVDLDTEIAESLLSLSKSAEGINDINAVCLVIKASQTRLSDRQIYIFDAVQSLFGRDIAENIVLLFTHSTGTQPKNALTAVKEAKVKCAVNDENQPVHFLFNNRQSDAADEEYEKMQEQSWNHSFRGMAKFFKLLNNMNPKTLKMTRNVLQKWKQLEANISNLQSCVQKMEQKQNELKQTQEALEKNRKYVEDKNDFEYEEKTDIDPSGAKAYTPSTVYEENCHPKKWCYKKFDINKLKNNHCTESTNKYHHNKYNTETNISATKEKRTNEDLKEYNDKIRDGESQVQKLEEEIIKLDKEKVKLVFDAFYSVEILEMIALNTDSLNTLQHIDYLIEKLKEENENEKTEKLEKLRAEKRAGEKKTP